MSLEFAVLFWLHIFAAIGWLGSGMVFGMMIGPTIPTLSPGSRSELIVKLFPRYLRFLTITAVLTPIFGLALAFAIGNGSFAIFQPNSTAGISLSIGVLLTIILWIVLFAFSLPAGRKVIRLTQEAMKNPGPPSPELLKANARLRAGGAVGLVMLLLIFTTMVAAVTL